ncbi:MAG: alpha-L-fucosidase [Caldicoprobacterales bacterium]
MEGLREIKGWELIDRRPIPAWFDNVKFGIFIHWGVYSVPAWGPKKAYAEWYGHAIKDPNSDFYRFHKETYGEKFEYKDFAPMFRAELFDADSWAELFKEAGAGYVVLTSKHHDGFCLWPSVQSPNWNSCDVGPRRDIVGELTAAVRKRNLKMGLYYSLMEWDNPLYLQDPSLYATKHMIPQMKDIINTYSPDLLFTDGEWDHSSHVWRSQEFLTWLFNESKVRDQIVVNDRWGKETRSRHGGYYTTEYGEVTPGVELDYEDAEGMRKWEECRGIGSSFGYNRNENLKDYMTETELIHLLVDTVSKGGNLLLNIGPAADGTIPVIMEERLLQIGDWLKINGEAIYGTKPWTYSWTYSSYNDNVRFTRNDRHLYAICLDWPEKDLKLNIPNLDLQDPVVRLLGYPEKLDSVYRDNELYIKVPTYPAKHLPIGNAYAFKIEKAFK